MLRKAQMNNALTWPITLLKFMYSARGIDFPSLKKVLRFVRGYCNRMLLLLICVAD